MRPLPYATSDRGVDLVAVERVLKGTLHHSALDPEWRVYAARHSDEPAKSVAQALGVAEKTVIRWRAEAGDAPA
ncbi:hypothetical protein [Streptomyces milbemycinicus]|uniref:Transposase n=1 Tax=Streptomyces milbemycinicus TaxID=476552 RepID=A0ABW8LJB5_9ACTN